MNVMYDMINVNEEWRMVKDNYVSQLLQYISLIFEKPRYSC